MVKIYAGPAGCTAIDSTIDSAAGHLADSIVEGVINTRCMTLVCLLLWALWLPAHIIVKGL